MDLETIKRIMTDQLQEVDEVQSTLHQLSDVLQLQQEVDFQNDMCHMMNKLQQFAEDVSNKLGPFQRPPEAQNNAPAPAAEQVQHIPDGDCIPLKDAPREEEVIRENEEFMEGIEPQQEDDVDKVGRNSGTDLESYPHPTRTRMRTTPRCTGWKEKSITLISLCKTEDMIEYLARQPTCASRRFELGTRDRRTVYEVCALPTDRGTLLGLLLRSCRRHAEDSDSSRQSKMRPLLGDFLSARRELQVIRPAMSTLQGPRTPAICLLPEQHAEIERRLRNARAGREDCLKRLRNLERDIRLFHHPE
ncbi:unnamed protein product [Heligmosomoides polygyrus]|uniref:t-SNARE coiled-coil homology domain-containing protein n=1 Tax=Heligmosomoides polygyrus TaxID=6339 RepID=A0A183G4K0_HELPZ|nr:unnamed protein product [Heligmosomoides polygyrus]